MKDNRTIIEKADIAVSNLISSGGYLNAEQANAFIRMIIDQPTIINECRTVRMSAPKRKIEKIGFGSRILRAAPSSGTALDASKRAAPDLGLIELETEEIIAEVWLPYDVLEDNIERGGLEQTIMTMIAERAALDLEELIVLGDTGSADSYLALVDGILALTPTGHTIDGSGITDIDKGLFKEAIQRMPTRYLRNRAMMKHYVSHHVEMEYRDSIADRATSLGDEKISKFTPMFAYGTPVQPTAMMPDNKLFLSYPKNIVWGIQRDIMIETDKDIRRRVLIIVLTMRCDVKIEEPQACVVVENFTDAGLPSTTTTTTV
jgi:HK97 family phage major capsid protein